MMKKIDETLFINLKICVLYQFHARFDVLERFNYHLIFAIISDNSI